MTRAILPSFLAVSMACTLIFSQHSVVHAADVDRDFLDEVKEEFAAYKEAEAADYKQYLEKTKKDYDMLRKSTTNEFNRIESLTESDLNALSKLLKKDYDQLVKKVGNTQKLNEYHKYIDAYYTGFAMDLYEKTIDPYYEGYAMDLYEKDIDPYYTGYTMDLYEKEIDPYYTGYTMDLYQKEVDPYYTGYTMDLLQKESDSYYSGYTMDLYESGSITKREAEKRIEQKRKEYTSKLESLKQNYQAKIAQKRKETLIKINTRKDQTIAAILKQRKDSLNAISNKRKAYFGSGISFPPLQLGYIRVVINGEVQIFEQSPVVQRGNTLVPLRAIFEKLGAQVDWNASNLTVTAVKGETKISLQMNKQQAQVGNKSVTLPIAAQMVNGYAMVPLRFVSEGLGAQVHWDASSQTVTITTSVRPTRSN
ncbi:copper amine oxidase N-terminal domain-containing protein [Brevibacillus dissolubilis]|uniref:copper amine oxidase N-terminal domain-containing protein n=1 Tax=Brevibacillus dissolubilis TaxID=1844116 RepID=UPI001116B7E4|nr:copper amine oxidase N-terminal domain-containing protein [Brevibacillus dissolubilis]